MSTTTTITINEALVAFAGKTIRRALFSGGGGLSSSVEILFTDGSKLDVEEISSSGFIEVKMHVVPPEQKFEYRGQTYAIVPEIRANGEHDTAGCSGCAFNHVGCSSSKLDIITDRCGDEPIIAIADNEYSRLAYAAAYTSEKEAV